MDSTLCVSKWVSKWVCEWPVYIPFLEMLSHLKEPCDPGNSLCSMPCRGTPRQNIFFFLTDWIIQNNLLLSVNFSHQTNFARWKKTTTKLILFQHFVSTSTQSTKNSMSAIRWASGINHNKKNKNNNKNKSGWSGLGSKCILCLTSTQVAFTCLELSWVSVCFWQYIIMLTPWI